MWYGCLTKQLGGEIVYHCTIFGWVSNMIWYWCYLSNHDCYVVSAISLCLTAKLKVGYIVSLHNSGLNVFPYNLGPSCLSTQVWYGCLSKQFGGIFVYHCNLEVLYGVLWYWWYVPWLVSKISLSFCKSGYGRWHVLIDYVNWYFLCVREIYVSLIMDV